MPAPHFILALDESGQAHIRDTAGRRYGYIEGGLVVPADKVTELGDRLDAFKDVFVGNVGDEVKSHELASAAGSIGSVADYEHALAHVTIAFRDCGALVAGAFLDKSAFDRPPDGALIVENRGGGVRVNQRLLFETTGLLFGGFLGRNNARGDIVHDELSGRPIEAEWSASFDALATQHPEERGRIDSLRFEDSKTSKLVQMADVAIGLLRAHFEKRTVLRDGALEMVREAERNGLLLNVQP